jgi:hypothetical protein
VLGDVYGADIEQIDDADAVVLWGCDMVRTVQHLQPAVQRLAKRGVPVLAIDIYRSGHHPRARALGRPRAARAARNGRGAGAGAHATRLRARLRRSSLPRLALHRRDGVRAPRLRRARPRLGERHHRASQAEISELADLLGRAKNLFLKTGVGFGRRRNGAMSMRAVCSLVAVLGDPIASTTRASRASASRTMRSNGPICARRARAAT